LQLARCKQPQAKFLSRLPKPLKSIHARHLYIQHDERRKLACGPLQIPDRLFPILELHDPVRPAQNPFSCGPMLTDERRQFFAAAAKKELIWR
jgi:hypothetical protein